MDGHESPDPLQKANHEVGQFFWQLGMLYGVIGINQKLRQIEENSRRSGGACGDRTETMPPAPPEAEPLPPLVLLRLDLRQRKEREMGLWGTVFAFALMIWAGSLFGFAYIAANNPPPETDVRFWNQARSCLLTASILLIPAVAFSLAGLWATHEAWKKLGRTWPPRRPAAPRRPVVQARARNSGTRSVRNDH
jgi:hypothetical protein